ncbi:hypothetical protein BDF21DRAFT_449895 [Thamnidium elegans]|nr:hypothetical protein BDF21DRAFT_449895 [Thamnidium elegans]
MSLIFPLFAAVDYTSLHTISRNCEKEDRVLTATWKSSEQRGRKHFHIFTMTYTFGATSNTLYIEQLEHPQRRKLIYHLIEDSNNQSRALSSIRDALMFFVLKKRKERNEREVEENNQKKKIYIERDKEGEHERLYKQYFAKNTRYPSCSFDIKIY